MSDVSHYYLAQPDSAEFAATTTERELLRVAMALNRGNSAEQVIDILFDSLDSLVPFDRIGLALLSPLDRLTIKHVRSCLPITWGVGASATITGTSLEPIVRQSKIRIINDLEAYAKEHPRSTTAPLMLAEGMRSSLTLPVFSEAGPIGVLFFSSRWSQAYGPHHVMFLNALAAGIGLAIERARMVDDLQRMNDELKSVDQLKTNFLSNLSHELRTPLSQVLGFADLLQETGSELVPEHQGYLAQIIEGGQRLKRLLDDLFDYTALESGAIAVRCVEFDWAGLVREVVDELRPGVPDALSLELALPDSPAVLSGDPSQLSKVVRSLVDNAVKFTPPPGRVRIEAGCEHGTCRLRVSDTGIGIAPEHQPRVFDKFFQAQGGSSREHGGTGLSMALAKAIVLAHGGTLELTSELGRGSTFEVRVPAC